ncbi:DUF445 domain-containing protein [Ottowia sp.]|uniref:DUF445 domain-containing protein n=1 Tax=Ottowia sp. TaxID=1898956 RepID=UPI003949FB65
MAKKSTGSEADLRRKQYLALGCLAVATLIFIGTSILPPTFSVRFFKAGAEAAMVGSLADWFAVVALFRHPLGLRIPHTAIIPNSKDRISDNLANFVREKFLNPQILTQLIRRSDPAQRFAGWLAHPDNARRIGRHTADLMSGWLDLVDDRRIQLFISDVTRTLLGKLDFSKALGAVLEMLTQDGRHQQLLDAALTYVKNMLREPAFRHKVAERVVAWLKDEHKWKQMVLPTDWIGDQAAEAASSGLNRFLEEVANSPTHDLRKLFDGALRTLVANLKTDEKFQSKGDEIKAYIQNNPELTDYARSLWATLRDWISNDLETSSSQLQQQVEKMGRWLGGKLMQDDKLRASINDHIESFSSAAAPQFANFLTHHISDTVRKWDAEDLSHQIELSIGPDLQYIRISGTVVGGCIGLLLFLISHGIEAMQFIAGVRTY